MSSSFSSSGAISVAQPQLSHASRQERTTRCTAGIVLFCWVPRQAVVELCHKLGIGFSSDSQRNLHAFVDLLSRDSPFQFHGSSSSADSTPSSQPEPRIEEALRCRDFLTPLLRPGRWRSVRQRAYDPRNTTPSLAGYLPLPTGHLKYPTTTPTPNLQEDPAHDRATPNPPNRSPAGTITPGPPRWLTSPPGVAIRRMTGSCHN